MSRSLRIARYTYALSALVGAAVVAFVAVKAHAGADTFKVPLTGASLTPCVPPGAYLSGHLHITTRMAIDTRGTHLIVMINSAGAKILVPTEDGLVEFVSNENHEHELNSTPGAATEFTIHDSYRFNSAGTRENYRAEIKMHITINANGDITANTESSKIDCIIPCCEAPPL